MLEWLSVYLPLIGVKGRIQELVDTNVNVSAIKIDHNIVCLHFFNRNSNLLDCHRLIKKNVVKKL